MPISNKVLTIITTAKNENEYDSIISLLSVVGYATIAKKCLSNIPLDSRDIFRLWNFAPISVLSILTNFRRKSEFFESNYKFELSHKLPVDTSSYIFDLSSETILERISEVINIEYAKKTEVLSTKFLSSEVLSDKINDLLVFRVVSILALCLPPSLNLMIEIDYATSQLNSLLGIIGVNLNLTKYTTLSSRIEVGELGVR